MASFSFSTILPSDSLYAVIVFIVFVFDDVKINKIFELPNKNAKKINENKFAYVKNYSHICTVQLMNGSPMRRESILQPVLYFFQIQKQKSPIGLSRLLLETGFQKVQHPIPLAHAKQVHAPST